MALKLDLDIHNIQLPLKLVNMLCRIDNFNGKWSLMGKIAPERMTSLQEVATIESIGSSTRIEGSQLSDQEIATILTNLNSTSFKSRDEQEVAGYAQTMQTLFSNWENIPISENIIRQLNRDSLQFSEKDERHRGEYKNQSNSVAAFKDGKQVGIIFETASPFETPTLMRQLVEWTNRELTEKRIHPLIVIAVFIVCFLAIHPFQDGNGRTSRILTTLLLLKCGYTYVPYSSLEAIIEANKALYYASLRKTQQSLRTENTDWLPWLEFFLRSLDSQIARLENKIERADIFASSLSELAQQILIIARDRGKVTIQTALELTGRNRSTIRYCINDLVKRGFLSMHGSGRGTCYKLTARLSFEEERKAMHFDMDSIIF